MVRSELNGHAIVESGLTGCVLAEGIIVAKDCRIANLRPRRIKGCSPSGTISKENEKKRERA